MGIFPDPMSYPGAKEFLSWLVASLVFGGLIKQLGLSRTILSGIVIASYVLSPLVLSATLLNNIKISIGYQGPFIGQVLMLAICLPVYFLPWIVANGRSHNEQSAILVTNLLTGWTFIGWVVALIWSTTSNVKAATPKP